MNRIDEYWKLVNEATTKAAKWLSEGQQSALNIETGMIEYFWSNQDARKVYDHFMEIAAHYRKIIAEEEFKATHPLAEEPLSADKLKDLMAQMMNAGKHLNKKGFDSEPISSRDITDEFPKWQTDKSVLPGEQMPNNLLVLYTTIGYEIIYNRWLANMGKSYVDKSRMQIHTAEPYKLLFAMSVTLDEKVEAACKFAKNHLAGEIDRMVDKALGKPHFKEPHRGTTAWSNWMSKGMDVVCPPMRPFMFGDEVII